MFKKLNYIFQINEFADLTSDEFKSTLNGYKRLPMSGQAISGKGRTDDFFPLDFVIQEIKLVTLNWFLWKKEI